MTNLSDYGDDDEVYDPDAYVQEIIRDLRRHAEGLKLEGNHSQIGLLMNHAADAMEDILSCKEDMLNNLLQIEDLVQRSLKNM